MKGLTDIKGGCTLEELAIEIMVMNGSMEHWAEVVINAGGNLVNVEVVVTAVNGELRGRQYVSEKSLPRWKRAIKRLLKI